jgi:hypothetical protein
VVTLPDDLPVDAMGWEGLLIARRPATNPSADPRLILGDGIDGLGVTPPNDDPTPRAQGGEWGGRHSPRGRLVATDCTSNDLDALWDLAEVMQPIESPLDERPLYWRGLLWGDDPWCVFARPVRCDWLTDEEAVDNDLPGFELAWKATDPTAYAAVPTQASLVPTGSPTTTTTFQAPNEGGYRRWARRAWDVRFTAHGTTTNPRIHVAHDDGTWERWQFTLTLTGGQVLTIREGMPRLNGAPIPGKVQVSTNAGGPGRARRPLRLLRSDGTDGNNVVTMSVATGAFSGFCDVRSTR